MNKLFKLLFPLTDHLYIFQLLEYDNGDFAKWFFQYPFKRQLQRKHTLVLTSKALFLLLIAFFLLLFLSFASSLTQFETVILIPLYFVMYSVFSPIFLIFANLLFSPIERYSRNKLIRSAQRKQKSLKNLKTVAIVGSFAKTSTKNMLYTLLWKDFYTVKTPKSYNTAVSIARSFLRDVKETTQIYIVEMDAYHPGEIKDLCQILKPDLGIITAIGAQHLERFGSMEKLAKTQFELAQALINKSSFLRKQESVKPENSQSKTADSHFHGNDVVKEQKEPVLFLNADDEWTTALYPEYDGIKQVFFGKNEGRDVQVSDIKVLTSSTQFTLRIKNEKINIKLPLTGEHHAINFASAASIAYQLRLPLKTIQQRAELVMPTEHRLEVKKAGHITIIDNSYNTNPTAARSSLKLLKETEGSEKIVITPGLVELGEQSEIENKLLGKEIAEVADMAIIVGEYAKEPIKSGLNEAEFPTEKTHYVKSTAKALDMVYKNVKKDAVILIENDLPDQYF